MTLIRTPIDIQCPNCKRKRRVTVCDLVPRNVVDCKCGWHAEIRPLKQTPAFKVWATDWFDEH